MLQKSTIEGLGTGSGTRPARTGVDSAQTGYHLDMTTIQIIQSWGWSGRRVALGLSLSLGAVLMFWTGNKWLSGIGLGLLIVASIILTRATLPKPPDDVLRVRR